MMSRTKTAVLIFLGILLWLAAAALLRLSPPQEAALERMMPVDDAIAISTPMLTDPFLQRPTETSVNVVWFTEFQGAGHSVRYGADLEESAIAVTTQLSRLREDADSQVAGKTYSQLTPRSVWRHEAIIGGLIPGQRLPYRVFSQREDGQLLQSRSFSLAPLPPSDQPLKILLTSDHQLMPLTPANLQKVQETVGQVDAVFLAGDLVNIPDRGSEWFDHAKGHAFFPSLQGRAHFALEKNGQETVYIGGELIQHAPLLTGLGNHEVMGRYSDTDKLKRQFGDAVPRAVAQQLFDSDKANADGGAASRAEWVKNHSFNTDTYEEIFSLPTAALPDGGKTQQYYATTFGNIRLISLYVTQIWRPPGLGPDVKGRYRERQSDLEQPESWGYGQHIFESIAAGSSQYQWLQQELASEAFQSAPYKIVMLHHPPHSLGDNIVPAFTHPVPVTQRHPDGSLQSLRYEYPKSQDLIIRDLVPLLEKAGVQLVYYGHSHLWNRFVSDRGVHFLESSNVGNTYGAHLQDKPRQVPPQQPVDGLGKFQEKYVAAGDPNGLEPVVPTLAPLQDEQGSPLPYIASNDITCFSLFDTATGTVSSYYFDARQPESAVVEFDRFLLKG
nr:metallophosphoesterase family protein [Romeria gracilis]